MTTPQDIQAALDEISETLHTLLDRCPRQAYDDLGKIYQSAQSRVDDLRELQSHVAAHDVVDLEAIKRELRGVIFPYSAVEKVIDHLAARGLLRTTPEDAKGDEVGRLKEIIAVQRDYLKAYQDGKYKLYSMSDEIRDAAIEHFPCGEGPLDHATRKALRTQPEHEGE